MGLRATKVEVTEIGVPVPSVNARNEPDERNELREVAAPAAVVWQVQAYDWPIHLAPAWDRMAICGAFVTKPARYWAMHAPLGVPLDGGRFGKCGVCFP